ncbi:SLBB domain-containing protein [Gallaecimonas sp. GXIMD4217]|uniref:SLBB domain-containing protein n=1 Tax=Gallaecimonas sp. GXIMD4217 TaxID=3131927 RepID=UPI00311B3146
MLRILAFVVVCVMALLLSPQAAAITPTPAMIEQFKTLPKSEQERLMRQYGLDPAMLGVGSQPGLNKQQVLPQELTPKQRKLREEEAKREEGAQPEDDNELKRFGMALFDPEVSTFAPVDNAPVPADYTLGPGDELLIQLFGKESQQLQLAISRDGSVNFPELGPIQLAGLHFGDAKALLQQRIQEQMIGVQAAISMGKLRTITVFVAGEARYPGRYTLSGLSSVSQAMFVAGGINDIGSLRNVQVKRGGKTVASFDLYDLLLTGDGSGDVRLQSGDVLFIPTVHALVKVTGEVRRPAIYELRKGETLQDAIQMSGGLKAGAYPRASTLVRFNDQYQKELIHVDLTSAMARKQHLQDGDELQVRSTSARLADAIVLAGHVARPGFFAFRDGLTVSGLLPSVKADLLASADLNLALVIRTDPQTQLQSAIAVELQKAIAQPGSAFDVRLEQGDKLLVFPRADEGFSRSELNARVQQKLKAHIELPEDMRWTNGDIFAEGFELSGQDNGESPSLSTEVAGVQITDAATAEVAALIGSDLLSSEEKDRHLVRAVKEILQSLYQDEEALVLSSQMTRSELLAPVIADFKAQAGGDVGLELVTLTGDVRVPGEYPLTRDGSVRSLVLAAGGLNSSAYRLRAELTRAEGSREGENGIQVAHLPINLVEVMQEQLSFRLQPRDQLNVFSTPDWNVSRTIEVRGEVRFPGTYTIQRGESLQDVLARAGGLNEAAFPQGAVFTREQIREREQRQVKKLSDQLRSDVATRALSAEQTQISAQDAMAMINQLERLTPVGRLVIDLAAILEGDEHADLPVEDGDVLYVPRRTKTVTVVGEVQHATSHHFAPGMDTEDYLKLSGGLRKRADDDRIYVIRADGSVMIPENGSWFAENNGDIRPGDTIVVPLDTEYQNSLSLWSQVTQIIYQSAVAIAAVATL